MDVYRLFEGLFSLMLKVRPVVVCRQMAGIFGPVLFQVEQDHHRYNSTAKVSLDLLSANAMEGKQVARL